MNPQDFAETLASALTFSDLDQFEELAENVVSARSFAEEGIMTNDAGFVIRMKDGTEMQVTLVRSR